jgi:hypothetical protein
MPSLEFDIHILFGSFPPIYLKLNNHQGQLAEEIMVAVKRLKQSTLAKKGREDFVSGVEAMAGLRHASLVRLLAYCNQGKERILVYEYLEKSLDNYIFGIPS